MTKLFWQKKTFFGVKNFNGAIFAGVRSQWCGVRSRWCEVRRSVLQIMGFVGQKCGARPPTLILEMLDGSYFKSWKSTVNFVSTLLNRNFEKILLRAWILNIFLRCVYTWINIKYTHYTYSLGPSSRLAKMLSIHQYIVRVCSKNFV